MLFNNKNKLEKSAAVIGRGSYGYVTKHRKRVTDNKSGVTMFLSFVTKHVEDTDITSIVRESVYYSTPTHKVRPSEADKLEGEVEIPNIPFLGETLYDYMKTKKGADEPVFSGSLFGDFLVKIFEKSMRMFCVMGCFQADYKPDNVITNGTVIDGTLMRHVLAHFNTSYFMGCQCYRAPEILIHNIHPEKFKPTHIIDLEKSHVWSMGCLLLYVLTKRNLFDTSTRSKKDVPPIETLRCIDKYCKKDPATKKMKGIDVDAIFKKYKVSVSKPARDIIKNMLKWEPEARFFMHECLERAYKNSKTKDGMKNTPVLPVKFQIFTKLISCVRQPPRVSPKALKNLFLWSIQHTRSSAIPIGALASMTAIYDSIKQHYVDAQYACDNCVTLLLIKSLVVSGLIMGSDVCCVHASETSTLECEDGCNKTYLSDSMSRFVGLMTHDLWAMSSHPFHLKRVEDMGVWNSQFASYVAPTCREIESVWVYNMRTLAATNIAGATITTCGFVPKEEYAPATRSDIDRICVM